MKTNKEKHNLQRLHKTHRTPSKLEYTKVIGIICLTVLIGLKRFWGRLDKRVLIITTLIGCIVGWAWCIFILNFDMTYASWMYRPSSIIGIEFLGMTLEDWIFFPACGILFILIMEIIPRKNDHHFVLSLIMNGIRIISCLIIILYGDLCSYSILIFAVPGTILYLNHKYYDFKHDMKCGVIFIIFAGGWDLFFAQWHYISWINDTAFHSVVYFDYPKGWVCGFVPIAILPWFTVAGWWFIYGLYYRIKGE